MVPDDTDGESGAADDASSGAGATADRSTDAAAESGDDSAGTDPTVEEPPDFVERYATVTGSFVRIVELAAASVFAVLFAIGVIDLSLQIVESGLSGAITEPQIVIGFIDTGLLLLIIVEVYQTVIAYIEADETRRIVRLVIYTGVIAMVRKAIIFRTGEYATTMDALFAAVSYTIIVLGLAVLLFVEGNYLDRLVGDV